MSASADKGHEAGVAGGADAIAAVATLHDARARAEIAAADRLAPGADAVLWRGDPLGDVVVVKGLPGPAEAAGGDAVSGADGDAVDKALAALGYDPARVFYTLSRPEQGMDRELRVPRLRMQVEAVDPRTVVALDAEAAEDVGEAFGVRLAPGVPVRALGRLLVAVDGLEASLADEPRKKIVWRQLQAARPAGPIY